MNETLEQYRDRITKMNEKERKDASVVIKRDLKIVESCQEIKNTITYKELKLLFYLRNCRFGKLMRFLHAAKLSNMAYSSFLGLSPHEK